MTAGPSPKRLKIAQKKLAVHGRVVRTMMDLERELLTHPKFAQCRIDEISTHRVKEIRREQAHSPKEFERLFGIPSRTLEGWEQGRKVDATARILLTLIAREPELIKRIIRQR